MSDTVGFFIWTQSLKGPTPSKIDADLFKAVGASLSIISRVPLDAKEWKLPLDTLAERYPLVTA